MSTTTLFFLLVFAITGTILVVFNPSRELLKAWEGHRKSEVKAAQKAEQGKYQALSFGVILELLQSVIVEPAYILYGINHHLGNIQIAQGALLIFIANIVIAIGVALYLKRRRIGDWVYPMTNWPMHYVRTAIFSMPTLYLWYLFFIGVGIIGSGPLSFGPIWLLAVIFVVYVAATVIFRKARKPIIDANPKEATAEERDHPYGAYTGEEMPPPQQW